MQIFPYNETRIFIKNPCCRHHCCLNLVHPVTSPPSMPGTVQFGNGTVSTIVRMVGRVNFFAWIAGTCIVFFFLFSLSSHLESGTTELNLTIVVVGSTCIWFFFIQCLQDSWTRHDSGGQFGNGTISAGVSIVARVRVLTGNAGSCTVFFFPFRSFSSPRKWKVSVSQVFGLIPRLHSGKFSVGF